MQAAICKDVITNLILFRNVLTFIPLPCMLIISYKISESRCLLCRIPLLTLTGASPPYRRRRRHAARGTDAVKQELHALCAGSSKTVVTVECYPGTDQAEILALFPHAELIIHADDLAIQPAELDAKIEHELTDDPVFGIMTTWQMKNFYPEEALCAARGKI